MFWIGFVSIYIVLFILCFLMKWSSKWLSKILVGAKTVVCAVEFTLVCFLLTLSYLIVLMVTENITMNSLLCAVFLVFSWFIEEKLYQLLAGANGHENEQLKILTKEDKNLCALFALVGAIFSGMVLYHESRNSEYFILISVAISIWIGTYVPVEEVYNGTPVKKIVCTIKENFMSKKRSVWITTLITVVIVSLLVSRNEVCIKIRKMIIDEFAKGVTFGSLLLIIILIIVALSKKKK